jgi:hypothetical protein
MVMLWMAKGPDGAVSLLRSSNSFCMDIWPKTADRQKLLRKRSNERLDKGSEES